MSTWFAGFAEAMERVKALESEISCLKNERALLMEENIRLAQENKELRRKLNKIV